MDAEEKVFVIPEIIENALDTLFFPSRITRGKMVPNKRQCSLNVHR